MPREIAWWACAHKDEEEVRPALQAAGYFDAKTFGQPTGGAEAPFGKAAPNEKLFEKTGLSGAFLEFFAIFLER